jgi:hypothetical protein
MEKVSKANYISCFDAKCGYWQTSIQEGQEWLTAFVCGDNVYEFTRMPFGLKSAGNTFVRAMNIILRPVRDFTEPFIDDMAVCSMEWLEHLSHLDKYLHTIKNAGITLNLRKCDFAQSYVKFVGHVVGSGLIKPDPDKIKCLLSMEAPTTKKEVKRLIGFFSYFRSFVDNFAEKAKVITDLTKKEVPSRVPWKAEHQLALDNLKADLAQNVQLFSIDYMQDFEILVDASQHAVGCCLLQRRDNVECPIAFASSKLTVTQSKWSTIEREAYAVIWALKKFRPWILFSRVTIHSDHNPLTYLTEAAPKSAKLTRWALALQEYNLVFKYRPAGLHKAADYLSRL